MSKQKSKKKDLIEYLKEKKFEKPWKPTEKFDVLAVFLTEEDIQELLLALEVLRAKRAKKKAPEIQVTT